MDNETEALLERLKSVDSLAIDDVGCEDMTPDFKVQFSALIDYRYAHRKTTVLVTNLTFDRWKERYGERTVSRIVEWARDNFLQTVDPDLRTQDA